MSSFLVLAALIAAPDVWVAPSHVHIHRMAEDASRTRVAHVHAARGDREAFQLVFTADDRALEQLHVVWRSDDEELPAPEIFQVGLRPVSEPSGRAVGQAPAWPDLLLSDTPRDLAEGDTAVWWVRFDPPREMSAGVYWGELVFEADNQRRLPDVEVRVEVFDVVLPETPALSSFLPLDLALLAERCELFGTDLESWRGVYDPLASYPLGFGWPWLQDRTTEPAPEPPPLRPASPVEGETATAAPLAEGEGAPILIPTGPENTPEPGAPPIDGRGPLGHWAWLAAHAPAARFDWTPTLGYSANRRFQQAWRDTGFPDDVRALLDAARDAGILPRSHVLLEPPAMQVSFADVTLLSNLLRQTHAGVPRMFAGPPHPAYQRLVDQYALPLTDFQPGLTSDLRSGQPLTSPKAHPSARVEASESGWRGEGPWVATRPEDAYDGSLVSEWHTEKAPTARAPAAITLHFPESIDVKHINCYWALGRQPREVTVETSFDGEIFTSATVRWDEQPHAPPFTGPWWAGTFRYANTLRALRLIFRHTANDRPVGLAEITFDAAPPPTTPRLEPSVQPWLLVGGREYPALTVDAHAIEARLVAWLAWTFGYDGVYIPGVNRWPAPDAPLTAAATADFLFYPDQGRLAPSLRLERLRDGFEDYALLNAYAAQFDTPPPELVALRGRLERGLATALDAGQLDAAAENIVASRIAMGRALTRVAARAREDGS